ncbi:MAG: 23S rRNA (uracil(1939)-C(5))-methyltransferase RlmD [Clostridia bacterium]|nr:23S rRNA (uracil(1939)-C(5))-methyltransferase RlmD [Clostridia bacterium]
MLKKNTTLTLTITENNHLGFGVARHEGQIVFVSDALEGETVAAKILKVTKSYAVAKTEQILVSSPYRQKDPCPQKGCGGCVLGSVSYERELEIKKKGVEASFLRAGMKGVVVDDVRTTQKVYHYRNKAQYPVSQNPDGTCRIGFFAAHSHRVVEARHCLLQPEVFGEIVDIVGAFIDEYKISIYHEDTGKGLLRHIYLRRGEVTGEIMLVLVVCGNCLPHHDVLTKRLLDAGIPLVSFSLCENREDTNVVLGDTYHLLWGKPYIHDVLCGVRLKLSAPAFYQVNHDATELLYGLAADMADLKETDTLLDLYCGVGSIGLSMASRVKEVIGVEIVPSAVDCARENALSSGIHNATFYCTDAANIPTVLKEAEAERGEVVTPNVVILDPPRKGCDAQLLHFVSTLSPAKIVYISCNPDTLARDAALLTSLGYHLGTVVPVNLFPRTSHVESVVCLTRK